MELNSAVTDAALKKEYISSLTGLADAAPLSANGVSMLMNGVRLFERVSGVVNGMVSTVGDDRSSFGHNRGRGRLFLRICEAILLSSKHHLTQGCLP